MTHVAIANDTDNGILILTHAPNIIHDIDIMTLLSGTVIVATKEKHGFEPTIDVDIQGAVQAEYNGTHMNITVIDDTSFSFALAGSPASPATGTITVQAVGVKNAALKYFGADPYDEQDPSVLDPIIKAYFSSYSWDLNNHVLIEDIVSARLTKIDIFKGLCHVKWGGLGLHDNPQTPIINLFTGADLTALQAYQTMVATETTELLNYTTIATLDAYTPAYLQ